MSQVANSENTHPFAFELDALLRVQNTMLLNRSIVASRKTSISGLLCKLITAIDAVFEDEDQWKDIMYEGQDSGLSEALTKAEADIADLSDQIENQRAIIKGLEVSQETDKIRIQELICEVADRDRIIQDTGKSYAKRFDDYDKKSKAKSDEINTLRIELKTKTKLVDDLKEELTSRIKFISDLKAKNKSKDERINKLHETIVSKVVDTKDIKLDTKYETPLRKTTTVVSSNTKVLSAGNKVSDVSGSGSAVAVAKVPLLKPETPNNSYAAVASNNVPDMDFKPIKTKSLKAPKLGKRRINMFFSAEKTIKIALQFTSIVSFMPIVTDKKGCFYVEWRETERDKRTRIAIEVPEALKTANFLHCTHKNGKSFPFLFEGRAALVKEDGSLISIFKFRNNDPDDFENKLSMNVATWSEYKKRGIGQFMVGPEAIQQKELDALKNSCTNFEVEYEEIVEQEDY
jgi:hypothetical protein